MTNYTILIHATKTQQSATVATQIIGRLSPQPVQCQTYPHTHLNEAICLNILKTLNTLTSYTKENDTIIITVTNTQNDNTWYAHGSPNKKINTQIKTLVQTLNKNNIAVSLNPGKKPPENLQQKTQMGAMIGL